MNYAFAMTAPVSELAAVLGINRVTAASEEDQKQKAAKLAQNHGFLKGLMTRVGKHFQAAGAGAWRILRSGGVWFSLLSLCVSAVMFLFAARDLRHFKQQPWLGKMRVLGVGLSFGAFIGTFVSFFKKIAMAWKNEAADTEEKKKAEALLSRLSQAERVAMMARAQSNQTHASAAFSMLASALEAQGAVVTTAGYDEIVAKAKKLAKRKIKEFKNIGAAFAAMLKDSQVQKSSAIIAACLAYFVLAARSLNKALDRAQMLRAQRIFEKIQKSRSTVSPAVYTEVTKASKVLKNMLVPVA